MELTKNISKHNYLSFLWHATFLALAQSFMDVDTIIPAMLLESGGNAIHVGILTAIMLGGSSFTQLLFLPYLNNKQYKKKYLLAAINIRVLSLVGMAILLFYSISLKGNIVIGLIFVLITLFSFSGAFANISYTDILGKSIKSESRKTFLSIKHVVAGIGIFLSAILAREILSGYPYPENYTIMFFLAALLLGIASLGFWSIKEAIASGFSIKNLKDYKAAIKIEIKKNKRLKYFLGIVNTLGISISILPFLILYAKDNFSSDRLETGNYLLLKIAGSVLAGMFLTIISSKIKYKNLLYLTPLIFLLIPAYIMINENVSYFYILFFVGGIGYSFYSISISGVLLEITNNKNRALYTGIAGAGSIIPTIFTLLGGVLIQEYGFNLFFILFIIIMLSSIFFIHKLKCVK